jgi:hypothetical protein
MNEVVTIEEIEARFPDEWVLIDEPQVDDLSRLKAGRVVFHSPHRDQVHRKAAELHLPFFAVRYLGYLPDDTALVL